MRSILRTELIPPEIPPYVSFLTKNKFILDNDIDTPLMRKKILYKVPLALMTNDSSVGIFKLVDDLLARVCGKIYNRSQKYTRIGVFHFE